MDSLLHKLFMVAPGLGGWGIAAGLASTVKFPPDSPGGWIQLALAVISAIAGFIGAKKHGERKERERRNNGK